MDTEKSFMKPEDLENAGETADNEKCRELSEKELDFVAGAGLIFMQPPITTD